MPVRNLGSIIPQGSALMDFIAEMVWGYADLQIVKRKINKTPVTDYFILHIRDDYRIFVNNLRLMALSY
ncbi:MAG: hypothetical protein IPL83_16150 [Bdellovibrionales bacterium]|nr:hypothetical protein [Bdellovibrionales bacterium]